MSLVRGYDTDQLAEQLAGQELIGRPSRSIRGRGRRQGGDGVVRRSQDSSREGAFPFRRGGEYLSVPNGSEEIQSRGSTPFNHRGSTQRGQGGRRGDGSRRNRGISAAQPSAAFDSNIQQEKAQRGSHSRRSRGGSQIPRNQGGTKYLSKEKIESLACSDSKDIIQYITENEGSFLAAYNNPRYCHHPLILKWLIKLLYLLVMSEDKDFAARIVARIFDDGSGDTEAFRMSMEMMIRRMPGERRPHIVAENPQYLGYILEIGAFAIEVVPLSVMYTFPHLSLNDTVQKLSQLDNLHRGSVHTRSLILKAQALTEEFSNAPSQVKAEKLLVDAVVSESADLPPPPQHLTELPVLPSTDEVHPYAVKPYLRPNIVNGAYTDWEHYLDVQFRLMREDFVAPLRDGIKTYELKGATSKYLSEVRIYEGVSVCSTVCLFSGVGFNIRFDARRFKKVNWEHSKRLIFGSLLCLSCDNFQTIYFATVVKRDPKLLKDGVVTVQFDGDNVNDVFQIDPDQLFVMVESTAYFEAYRHILEGLKRASEQHLTERLQIFKRYIVDCQLQPPVAIPRYLRVSDKRFRLKEVIDIKGGGTDVVLTDINSWPPYAHTSLDSSQLCAFRAALTQEVSVIQGPPGTGKTFIGLKVVEALVANQQRCSNFPILVLCYTNHALDQFLEGILAIPNQGRKELNIVRIGGRCKTKSLEGCVLKAKIDVLRSQRILPARLHKPSSQLRKDIRAHQEVIEHAQNSVEVIESRDKVFKLSALSEFIQIRHQVQLTGDRPTQRGREIDVWLKLWYVYEGDDKEVPQTQEEQRLEELAEAIDDDIDSQLDSDDEFIQVDAEAELLEDERMIAGEEFELPKFRKRMQLQDELFASNTQDQEGDSEWSVVQISDDERRRRIKKGHSNRPMSLQEANAVINIWHLSPRRRWSLYLHWVNQLIISKKQLISHAVARYNEVCKEYTECRQEIDAYVIQEADIVGMTTTGAAKYNHILTRLYPKIIIIEEAAEVFEAHVFTSLTPSVQQLIMIGDHKQLRPKANCYDLEKNYAFCVSLFERLAINGFPVFTLEVQHRMRPEIASLICPSIYEKLLNHESVELYEHVKGVGSDLFFIDHKQPEKANDDKERSHSNDHEADFLVALCKYLLKQGYQPSEITILTMYRGQLLELKKRMHRADYSGVRVAAVDDFQGEENEIILLSLVRSNSDGNVGFLSIENRICVSLSRAKIGFFVIGNLSMLRNKDNTVWPQILADLSRRGVTGEALPLRCQVHPKSAVMASSASDFLKFPEGGCLEKCTFRLSCGHSCPRLCHPIDREHKRTKCKQKCPKILDCGHKCKYKCFECKDECPPCSELVVKRIHLCDHEVKMPCQQDPSTFACTHPCSETLHCGHICQELCSKPCTMVCRVKVEKELPCGHLADVPCFLDVSAVKCREPCDAVLDCGHQCSGQCGQCQRGRLHVRCQSKCGRTLVCSHECKFPCTPTCPPCMEECNNYCVHSKCQRKCYEPCVPCREPCRWKCDHLKCNRLCYELCDRPPCNEPCKKRLKKCGHPCIGLCGEKCPTKCRICDRDEVCEIFFGTEDDEDARFIQLEECKHLIEVEACDVWMEQANDDKPSEVQFKACPKCKTQIRKSLRYGNTVKKTLQDYESIKKKQLVSLGGDVVKTFKEVQRKIKEASSPILSMLGEKLNGMEEHLKRSSLPPHQINTVTVQLSCLTHVVKMVEHLSSVKSAAGVYYSLSEVDISLKDIQENVKILINFLMQEFLTNQQKSDIESEVYRLMSLIKLLDLWCKVKAPEKRENLAVSDRSNLKSMIVRVQTSGWKTEKFKEKDHDEILSYVTTMSEKYQVNGLTDAERIEIVQAIGLTKGHWFKCPNGHFYCIGECGGAMQEGKCPECGAGIGGRSHRLRADNQLAPEMDGARHAAWSEFTNLANFDPNQFN